DSEVGRSNAYGRRDRDADGSGEPFPARRHQSHRPPGRHPPQRIPRRWDAGVAHFSRWVVRGSEAPGSHPRLSGCHRFSSQASRHTIDSARPRTDGLKSKRRPHRDDADGAKISEETPSLRRKRELELQVTRVFPLDEARAVDRLPARCRGSPQPRRPDVLESRSDLPGAAGESISSTALTNHFSAESGG